MPGKIPEAQSVRKYFKPRNRAAHDGTAIEIDGAVREKMNIQGGSGLDHERKIVQRVTIPTPAFVFYIERTQMRAG